MKAIVQDDYGTVEVLELSDVDQPVVGDNEVLVRVHAAGVDPGVWHIMSGLPYLIRIMGYGLRRPKARIPGTDLAGRVETVGKDVTLLQPGDEVFGGCQGAFAEYVSVPEGKLAPKPEKLTFEQAAVIPSSGLTALQALRDAGKVEPDQTVLVIGAAGGVGTFAVQIAKSLGAEVTGVCSSAKVDFVRSLGADGVIDYTREDFVDRPERYDVILDTAGNRPLSRLRRALAPEGTLVLIGGEKGGPWLGGLERQIGAFLQSPFGKQKLRPFFAAGSREDLVHLAQLVESGEITLVVDRTFQLREVPEAIRYLQEGRAHGKVVVSVRERGD